MYRGPLTLRPSRQQRWCRERYALCEASVGRVGPTETSGQRARSRGPVRPEHRHRPGGVTTTRCGYGNRISWRSSTRLMSVVMDSRNASHFAVSHHTEY
jgi:hypothetical protein